MKTLISLILLLSSTLASAADIQPRVIERFFANYGLLARGWAAFVEGQSQVLSPEMVTIVRDHRGTTLYRGREGYFHSIRDWSRNFRTGNDFSLQYLGRAQGLYHVALHGGLLFNNGVLTVRIPEGRHCWEEIFGLDSEGRIARIEVNMNLNCRR